MKQHNQNRKPRGRPAPLYIDNDKQTYKVLSGQEMFRLVWTFEDFLLECGMVVKSASINRNIANNFVHYLEQEGRELGDNKAAGDFLAQRKIKSLSYRSALRWFYLFLERQRMTKIHPLGDLKVNLSYFRKTNPIIGKDAVLSTHNVDLTAQTDKIYQRDREIEFLQQEILKLKKAIRYKNDRMQDILDAWEDSNLYHRPITAGEARQHFNLLHGAISYRGPSHIDKPSGRSDVQALDSKGRGKKGIVDFIPD